MAFSPAVMTNDLVLSVDQCKDLMTTFGDLTKPVGTLTGIDTKVRKARAHALKVEDHKELYDLIIPQAISVNQQIWQYQLDTHDPLQLLKYTHGGHYDWHLDLGSGHHQSRKLSFIVGVSDESSYQGGQVVFKAGSKEQAFTIPQGKMILFPSFVLHKVTPVTQGERFVLVGWLRGDKPFQ